MQIEIGKDSFVKVKHHTRKHEDVAEFSGDLLVLAVGNSRQAGGGNQLCPDAIMDDGVFDITYAVNISPDKIPEIIGKLFDSESSVRDMPEVFGQLRSNWLEVDCPDELQVIILFQSHNTNSPVCTRRALFLPARLFQLRSSNRNYRPLSRWSWCVFVDKSVLQLKLICFL